MVISFPCESSTLLHALFDLTADILEISRSFSSGLGIEFVNGRLRKPKIGRNELYPCGSGKK
jgi:hypothetical protein